MGSAVQIPALTTADRSILNNLASTTGIVGTSNSKIMLSDSSEVTTKIRPATDDGAPLGDTTHTWSDLFLASGGIINFANGNVTLTHTTGTITLGVGTLKIVNPTDSSTSVVTTDGAQTLVNKNILATEVDGSVTANLTSANVSSTVITNYGQTTATQTLTLPAAAAGMNFIAVVGTTQASYYWKIKAASVDKIYLDGVAGTDNQCAQVTPAIGNFITFATFKTGAAAWDWLATTGNGTWTAQA